MQKGNQIKEGKELVDLVEQRRQKENEKAKKLAETAAKNGIKITFAAKPAKSDLEFTRALRRVYK